MWSIIMIETTKKDVKKGWQRYKKKEAIINERERIIHRI